MYLHRSLSWRHSRQAGSSCRYSCETHARAVWLVLPPLTRNAYIAPCFEVKGTCCCTQTCRVSGCRRAIAGQDADLHVKAAEPEQLRDTPERATTSAAAAELDSHGCATCAALERPAAAGHSADWRRRLRRWEGGGSPRPTTSGSSSSCRTLAAPPSALPSSSQLAKCTGMANDMCRRTAWFLNMKRLWWW